MNTVKIAIVLFAGTAEGFKNSKVKILNNGGRLNQANDTGNASGQNMFVSWPSPSAGVTNAPRVKEPAATPVTKAPFPEVKDASGVPDKKDYKRSLRDYYFKKSNTGCKESQNEPLYSVKEAVKKCTFVDDCSAVVIESHNCDVEEGWARLCRITGGGRRLRGSRSLILSKPSGRLSENLEHVPDHCAFVHKENYRAVIKANRKANRGR